jgi:hypothetical protein
VFGMLDYRAHKLYVLLFAIPNFIVGWIFIIGKPLLSYVVAYSYLDSGITKIVGAILILFLGEIVLMPIGLGWGKFVNFLFTLIVDIIPADGRTKEEAQLVAWRGDKAITALNLSKHPREWTEESIENAASLDWIQSLFYGRKVTERIRFIKDKYEELEREHGSYPTVNESLTKKFLIEGGLEPQTEFEKFITNKVMRLMVYPYLILVLLLVANPFNYQL